MKLSWKWRKLPVSKMGTHGSDEQVAALSVSEIRCCCSLCVLALSSFYLLDKRMSKSAPIFFLFPPSTLLSSFWIVLIMLPVFPYGSLFDHLFSSKGMLGQNLIPKMGLFGPSVYNTNIAPALGGSDVGGLGCLLGKWPSFLDLAWSNLEKIPCL